MRARAAKLRAGLGAAALARLEESEVKAVAKQHGLPATSMSRWQAEARLLCDEAD